MGHQNITKLLLNSGANPLLKNNVIDILFILELILNFEE
jgi:hypothetical protein